MKSWLPGSLILTISLSLAACNFSPGGAFITANEFVDTYVFQDEVTVDTLIIYPDHTYYHYLHDTANNPKVFRQTNRWVEADNHYFSLVGYQLIPKTGGGWVVSPYMNSPGNIYINYNISGKQRYKKID